MALIVAAKRFGHNSVRKRKEAGVLASCTFESQKTLQILVIQHILHPVASHVSAGQHGNE